MKEEKKKILTTEEKLQKIKKEYEKKLKKVKLENKRKEGIEKRKRWRAFLALLTMVSQEREDAFDPLSFDEESQSIVAGFLLSQEEAWFSTLQAKGRAFLDPLRERETIEKAKKKKIKSKKKEGRDVEDK